MTRSGGAPRPLRRDEHPQTNGEASRTNWAAAYTVRAIRAWAVPAYGAAALFATYRGAEYAGELVWATALVAGWWLLRRFPRAAPKIATWADLRFPGLFGHRLSSSPGPARVLVVVLVRSTGAAVEASITLGLIALALVPVAFTMSWVPNLVASVVIPLVVLDARTFRRKLRGEGERPP